MGTYIRRKRGGFLLLTGQSLWSPPTSYLGGGGGYPGARAGGGTSGGPTLWVGHYPFCELVGLVGARVRYYGAQMQVFLTPIVQCAPIPQIPWGSLPQGAQTKQLGTR